GGLRPGAYLQAGSARIVPFDAVALGGLDQFPPRILVELGDGRRANHGGPAGKRAGAGLGREGRKGIPAGAVIRFQRQRRREVVERRTLGIVTAAEIALPEKVT